MGLRLFSIGSLIVDGISVASLAIHGVGTDSLLNGLLLIGATLLPPACYVAGKLMWRASKPTAELARQLAGFEISYI